MKGNTVIIIAAAVLVYMIWVKPKAAITIGQAEQEGRQIIESGFALGEKVVGGFFG